MPIRRRREAEFDPHSFARMREPKAEFLILAIIALANDPQEAAILLALLSRRGKPVRPGEHTAGGS